MGSAWRAVLGACALYAGCVPTEVTQFSLKDAQWFVVVGKVAAQGETAVSGIFPRPAAIELGAARLSEGIVLGWKTLPAGLSEPLDRGGRIAVDCDATLPVPDEVIALEGTAPLSAPLITGPWLERSDCPLLAAGLAIDNPCALDQCSVIITEGTACGFRGMLDPRCGFSAPVSGRVDRVGPGCLRVHTPSCDPDPRLTNVNRCELNARSCELSAYLNLAPLKLERHALVSSGPLLVPPVASRLDAQGNMVQAGIWVERLNDSMRRGYASDLIVVGERVLTLEHAAPISDFSCTASSAPDLLRTYALDLAPLSTTTVAPCAARLIAGPGSSVMVLHRSGTPSISLVGAGPTRQRALVGPDSCQFQGQQPVGAVSRDGMIVVLMSRVDTDSGAPTLLARIPADLSRPPTCVELSTLEHALNFYVGANGRGIASDSGVNGIVSFDLDGSELRPHKTRTGFGGADLGQSFEVENELIAAVLPARQASIQFWDFRGRSNPEPLPPAHQAAWGKGPILIGPYLPGQALVALWSPRGDREVNASLGLLKGPDWRFAPVEEELGPGLVGAIAAHPGGGSLVLMPWTGEVVRVVP